MEIDPTYKRYLYQSHCPHRCGRVVESQGQVCGPCRKALSEGYYLSPAPGVGEKDQPGRAERLERYARLAAEQKPLFRKRT